MNRLAQKAGRHSKFFWLMICLALLGIIGLTDYLTGPEMFFWVFYMLDVALAVWFVSRNFGLIMSFLSVAVWIAGDVKAGAQYSSSFILAWNSAILAAFYLIVVWLLNRLHSLQMELENRVKQRTTALTTQMAERERLEREILEISERERRRIGRELHDSLCQHLTGTALAGQVLEEKLAARSQVEAVDASRIVGLVEEGITLARDLARGIYPVEVDAEGLMAAFRELSDQTGKRSRVNCAFECDTPVLVHDATTATHLYRIAQEAVRNALQHGRPERILINLSNQDGQLTLTVEDDGTGLPEHWQKMPGVGTRIMAHRAAMIGAAFTLEPNTTGGTFVKCTLPSPPAVAQPAPEKL